MRGRVSYRGDGQHRNDWGVFATYEIGFGPDDRLTFGGDFRERRYPRGPLRERTRDIAEATGSWTHSLANGRTALTVRRQRRPGVGDAGAAPDGDASFWGVNGEVDHAFSDDLDAFLWWSYLNEGYDDERPTSPPTRPVARGTQRRPVECRRRPGVAVRAELVAATDVRVQLGREQHTGAGLQFDRTLADDPQVVLASTRAAMTSSRA